MSVLFLITARAGSKGIPGKNYKLLGGKPLIQYSLEVARKLTSDDHICISTDDHNVVQAVEKVGYKVPFIRPESLATDTSGAYEVMRHALSFFEQKGRLYELLVLLQPTSPFRNVRQVQEALDLFTPDADMVISVKETKANPYYLLMEEDEAGWLQKSKTGHFVRRQDAPTVYELNGAVYVINVHSLKKGPLSSFKKVRKYVMDEISSVDLDTPLDWLFAETLIEKGWIQHEP